MGKGTGTAKAQLDLENQRTQDQLNQQKAIRDKIISATDKYTTGAGEGYDPAAFAAMISSFLNQNSQNFGQARGQVLAGINARGGGGGDQPIGGDYARSLEGLEGAQATNQSQGVLGANISNLTQALNNRFNALNVQSGQAAQVGENASTFDRGASSSLSDYIKAANTPGFLQSFATSLAGTAAAGFGGGIANAIGKIPGFGKPK